MKMHSCVFTGHRLHKFPWKENEAGPQCMALKTVLMEQIMALAEAGVTDFFTGGAAGADCYLCGGGIENLIPSYWGQNNIALISLNTFDIKPIEINRYDGITGQLIEEYAGTVSFGGGGSIDGGFSASLLRDYDRGYADGIIDFYGDEVMSADKAAVFLCADCLNELLPQEIDRCFGVGAIHLSTKEIRIFEKQLGGFGVGDFSLIVI